MNIYLLVAVFWILIGFIPLALFGANSSGSSDKLIPRTPPPPPYPKETSQLSETIEEKTFRLAHKTSAKDDWFISTLEEARSSESFRTCCIIVELAIAEERAKEKI